MGDYRMPTNASQVSRRFLPAGPTIFNIKYTVLSDLKDKPFDGNTTSDPWGHLTRFHETTSMCQPEGIIEDQVNLKSFSFSLVGRAKDWLLCMPKGVIKTWKELKDKFLGRFFTTT